MSLTKLVITLVVIAVLVVGFHDGYEVFKARQNVGNTASSVAQAAVDALQKNPKDFTGARAAANTVAGADNAVITSYGYDKVGNKISLTISVTASTWVLGHLDKKLTQNISKSWSTSVPNCQLGAPGCRS